MSKNLFTYGTLKQGHCRSPLLEDQNFLGKCHTANNFKLFQKDSYPCLVESEDSEGYPIFGETYEILKNKAWDVLDKIEGVPFLYDKKEIEVVDAHGNKINAIAYFYQQNVDGLVETGRVWPSYECRRWDVTGIRVILVSKGFQYIDDEKEKPVSPIFRTTKACNRWCEKNNIFLDNKTMNKIDGCLQLVNSSSGETISPVHKNLQELAKWCSKNHTIFGGTKKESPYWESILEPFLEAV